MLSSQPTHYDSCSKNLFEKPACTVRHLRAPASQDSDDGNQDDKRSNVRGFFKAKDQEKV